jgi:hypothetical protein
MARKTGRSRNKTRPAKPATHSRAIESARKRSAAGTRRRSGGDTTAKAQILETLVAANAEALALTIEPAWYASVKRNLHVILEHAALVDQFALPDEIEAAPVFRA